MYPDPNDPNNLERRQQILKEEERFQLQQEELRLSTAQRSVFFARLSNNIYFLFGLLEMLLLLRFCLRLFGANPQNAFAQFIYTISNPFIAPFSTLFVNTATNNAIFDLNLIVAMMFYSILGWIVGWTIRLLTSQ